MDDQPFDLSSPTRAISRRKNLPRDMNDQPLDFSSRTKAHLLSSEKQQKSAKEEKQMPVAERFFSPAKKDKSTIQPKSLTFDHSCKTILESLLTSPKEYIGSVLKAKTIMSQRSSTSPGAKRHKTSNLSSIGTFQENLKITKYSKSGGNNSRDYIESGSLTSHSSFKTVHDEQKITLCAYCDENDKRDYMPTESSTSAGQKRRYSNSDENDKSDYMTNEPLTSTAAFGNYDFASAQESGANSNQKISYECVHCNKNFAHSRALAYHCRIHGKPFICKYCKKEYLQEYYFIKHIEKHPGDGGTPFIRPKYKKGFSRKVNLDKHVTIRVNSPNEVILEKVMKTQENCLNALILEDHMKIHGNSSDKVNLEKHMTIHEKA